MADFTPEQIAEFERRYKEEFPDVDEGLMQALINQESAGNPNAVSKVGASGRTQIMPNTWPEIAKGLGYSDVTFDQMRKTPKLQDLGGKFYLAQQLKAFNNNIPAALGAYNAGPGYMKSHLEKNPNAAKDADALISSGIYPETSDYVKKIMSKYQAVPNQEDARQQIEQYKQKMFGENLGYLKATNKKALAENSPQLSEDAKNLKQFQDKISATYTDPEFERLMKLKQNYDNIKVRPELNQKLGIPNFVKVSDMQLGEGQYLSSPELADPNDPQSGGVIRNEVDFLQDIIKNKPTNIPLDTDSEVKLNTADGSKEKDKLSTLLQMLTQAQSQQSKDSGLLAMLKAGGSIADAFAFGRGANTTNLGTKGVDFLEKQLGQNVDNIKQQLQTRKDEIGLQSLEEKTDPNSQLSQLQTSFVKKMAGDLGMDISSINAMGATNANELMQSLAYLSKIKVDLDARQQSKIDKLKKDQMLTDRQAKDVTDFDTTMSNVDQIMDLLGRNSEWTGSYDGRVPDMLVGADQVAWRTAIGLLNDQYRRLITGAAAGDKEMAMLRSRLPQATDTYKDFIAKMEMFRQATANSRNTYLKNLGRKGKDVSEYETPSVSFEKGFTTKDDIKSQGNSQVSRQIQPDGRIALFDTETQRFMGWE